MWGQIAKLLTANVWTHDFTERLKMRRRAIAKADGLPDDDVGTYPQSIVDVKVFGGLRGAMLGGLLTTAGAAGALGVASLLGAFSQKPTAPAVETPSFIYRIRFGYRDGKPFKELLDESGNVFKESE